MENKTEVILRLYEEERNHARFHEQQRVSGSNILAIIAAGMIGLITFDKQISEGDLLISILMLFTGLYGIVFMLKATERRKLHFNRGYKILELLNDKQSNFSPRSLMLEADQSTQKSHPIMYRVPLAAFWVFYHTMISGIAVLLIVTIVFLRSDDWFGLNDETPIEPVTEEGICLSQ